MNYLDALQSHCPYRRKGWREWRPAVSYTTHWNEGFMEKFEDLTADDWEIREPVITLTSSQFWAATERTMVTVRDLEGYRDVSLRKFLEVPVGGVPYLEKLARQLGLGDVSRGPTNHP